MTPSLGRASMGDLGKQLERFAVAGTNEREVTPVGR